MLKKTSASLFLAFRSRIECLSSCSSVPSCAFAAYFPDRNGCQVGIRSCTTYIPPIFYKKVFSSFSRPRLPTGSSSGTPRFRAAAPGTTGAWLSTSPSGCPLRVWRENHGKTCRWLRPLLLLLNLLSFLLLLLLLVVRVSSPTFSPSPKIYIRRCRVPTQRL